MTLDYSLIIKVTNACNLNCSYCYHRRDSNRITNSSMTLGTVDIMIKNLLENNKEHAEFIWHGGEPLLAGIDFFKFVVQKQQEYNVKKIVIKNSIQTNATLLNNEYVNFFKENDIQIGISIDGPFDIHSLNRKIDMFEYEHILNSLKMLSASNWKYGILCVVGNQHIGQAKRFFELLKNFNIQNVGFLPCLVQENRVIDKNLTISPEEYAKFLIDFFEIWIHDDFHGLSVRNFDDCLRFFCNRPAKTCIHLNSCDSYLTVMPDGNIYLCDNFSSNDEHHVGHVKKGFNDIEKTKAMLWLKESMLVALECCQECKYYCACYGGCKYQRWVNDAKMNKRDYYCLSTHKLYDHIRGYFTSKGSN